MKRCILLLAFFTFMISCDQDSTNINGSPNDGQGGSLATFALAGDYLYTVDETDLNVFNVSEIENPVQVNSVSIGFNIETLFSYGDYLYIGSRDGMFIYEIDNPEFPKKLAEVQHFTACDPVVANDKYAFVTLWSQVGCGNAVNQLEVYDIAEITDPVLINTRVLNQPKGLGLYGDYLIVCDDEIKIFDVSDPESAVLVKSIDNFAFDVIIRDDVLIAICETGVSQYALNANDITQVEELSTVTF